VQLAVSRIDRFHGLTVLTAINKERLVILLTDNFNMFKENIINVRKVKQFSNLYARILKK
jgi:hypothetical protein